MCPERTEERWATAEMLRIKGELFLLQGAPGAAATAEESLQQGLDWARRRGALSWELCCATSLARLWRDQLGAKRHVAFGVGATTGLPRLRNLRSQTANGTDRRDIVAGDADQWRRLNGHDCGSGD